MTVYPFNISMANECIARYINCDIIFYQNFLLHLHGSIYFQYNIKTTLGNREIALLFATNTFAGCDKLYCLRINTTENVQKLITIKLLT